MNQEYYLRQLEEDVYKRQPQCHGQLNPVEEALWDGVNPN